MRATLFAVGSTALITVIVVVVSSTGGIHADLAFYLALVVMIGGASFAALGLRAWASRRETAAMAGLKVLQGIGYMLIAYSFTNPYPEHYKILPWLLVLLTPVIRDRISAGDGEPLRTNGAGNARG